MGLFGRLFRASPPPAPQASPSPAPAAVVIAGDVAARLTAGGTPLPQAVDTALRLHLEAERRAAEAELRGERIPFWLRRDEAGAVEMEDELRDRIAQRRAAEDAPVSRQD